jgi:hypothetical protein
MEKLKPFLIAGLILILGIVFVACDNDDDDDNGVTPPPPVDEWVGTWLSAGANVAPLLVAVFNYDSVLVVMNDDNTLTLNSHVAGGAWTGEIQGTYVVTESATGDIHSIALAYPAFEQEGIIQVVEGNPDIMNLEVVQTVPDIGATPRTPGDGFGSDPVLLDTNIQVYERQDE